MSSRGQSQFQFMKNLVHALLAGLIFCGCASPAKKLAARKQERYSAYAALSPEMQTLVNNGQIKVGMPMDAVYIAWGQPAQILTAESANETSVTWLYRGNYLQEYRYWTYRYYGPYRYSYAGPYLDTQYFPSGYTAAEVTFEKGLVKQWQNMPMPY